MTHRAKPDAQKITPGPVDHKDWFIDPYNSRLNSDMTTGGGTDLPVITDVVSRAPEASALGREGRIGSLMQPNEGVA